MPEYQELNGYSFRYAWVEIKRYADNVRAFLYPTNGNYILYARCKLTNEDKVPSEIEWKWDPNNCPKQAGFEYPLINNQYYYKQTIHRDNYSEQQTKKNTFQIYKGSTTPTNDAYPIVQCMNLAEKLNKKTIIIKKINILKDAQTVGASNASSIHILNTDNNNQMTLKNYINSLRVNDLPVDVTTILNDDNNSNNDYLTKKIGELPYTTPKLLLISQKDTPSTEYFTVEFYYTK